MCSAHRMMQLTAAALTMSMAIGAHAADAQGRPADSANASSVASRTSVANTAHADPRIRSLVRLAARRQAIEDASDRALRAAGAAWYPDTLRVGIFRIATASELRDEISSIASEVSRDVAPSLDAPALEALARWTVYVRRPLPEERGVLRASSAVITVSAGSTKMWGDGTLPFGVHDEVRARMFELVRHTTSSTFDEPLQAWLFNGSVSPVDPGDEVEQRARLDLATAESHVARRCVRGDFTMCATLLAIDGRPTDPLRAWYAPEDYRAMVSRIRLAPTDGRDAPRLQRRCLADDDAACTRLLASFDSTRIPPPTLDAPRKLLLHEALRLGGAGALARLRATHGSIGARLVAASGVTRDSLLASWRRRMIAETGAGIRPTPVVALASLGWTLFLAGLGLRRTRRCR